MHDSRTKLAFFGVLLLALVLVIVVSMRTGATPPVTPAQDVGRVRTEAVGTFIQALTTTAQARPSPSATSTSSTRVTASGIASGSATPACLGLRFVKDASIPDNTQMNPAQVFTKSWLVQNSGTCPWQPGFQVVLIGGLAMGGSPFQVVQAVAPGATVQVSIKMAAPTNQTGVVQGTWMITDTTGAKFGDYLSVVVVVRGTTKTPSPTAVTPTP